MAIKRAVVIFGAPFAGKTSMLVAFSAHCQRKLTRYVGKSASGVEYAGLFLTLPSTNEDEIGVLTLPGVPFTIDVWKEVLPRASIVCVALDPRSISEEANIKHLEFLESHNFAAKVACHVWTRTDLRNRSEVAFSDTEAMNPALSRCGVRQFKSEYRDAPSLVAPLSWLVGVMASARTIGAGETE
jgi:hypothetical protein